MQVMHGRPSMPGKCTDHQQHARRATQGTPGVRIARFLAQLRQTAEQLDPVQRWHRILSEALKRYLKGRQLDPAAALLRPELLAVVVRGGKIRPPYHSQLPDLGLLIWVNQMGAMPSWARCLNCTAVWVPSVGRLAVVRCVVEDVRYGRFGLIGRSSYRYTNVEFCIIRRPRSVPPPGDSVRWVAWRFEHGKKAR